MKKIKKSKPIKNINTEKLIFLKNSLSEEEYYNLIQNLANEHSNSYKKIDDIVKSIRNLVTKGNSLKMLHQSYFMYLIGQLGIVSEYQSGFENNVSLRMIDYVQSIIVSSEPQRQDEKNDAQTDLEENQIWEEIFSQVSDLYSNLSDYHIYKSAYLKVNDQDYDPEYDALYVQAQELRTNVRGQRYSAYEIPHLRDLLNPHEDIFNELFNITVEEFLTGISKLQHSLMQGVNDGKKEMELLLQKTVSVGALNFEEPELESIRDSVFGKLFGYDLFDVKKVTGLPNALLRELSWAPGEESSFFEDGEYAGWPLRRMPIEIRPFIFLDNKYYCFDAYSLFENLYRIIQRLLFRLKADYKDTWNEKQKKVSEELPFVLFNKLLNKPEIHKSVYYQSKVGKKLQWCENDGIIIYDDHIIIIEVKAGSFTYTSPATDFPAYINSIKTLVKSPHDQATRFIDYILSEDVVTIYDEEHKPIRELKKNNFRQITICCVTLENFTSFSSRINQLNALGIKFNELPVWSLSIDDLRVYTDYFESPLLFTHFLEKRIKASKSDELELFDELDHLGMYIKHNDYSRLAGENKEVKIMWQGYREDLDKYFVKLIFDEQLPSKPKQELPQKIQEVIGWLDLNDIFGKSKIVSSLLNLDEKTRWAVEENITKVLERQNEINKTLPLSIFGEARITFICKQIEVESYSDEYSRDYVLATLLKANDEVRLGLYLSYSSDGKLDDVEYEYLTKEDIPQERKVEIERLADILAERRIISYKNQTGKKKIGRNDLCPCGSGRKYKRCCI
ncbi:SEC-C metal-binding domain-containing protein [Exiguobacterium sp. s127]|uniref:SEC-C metal-binding domain-containing protein n=1 Tax=Exiguobacterium sp. s127 TaxID=2751210 RepID=UPI001BE85F6C|nr:SEC-C metal-binding domain-containing protein [Exiguobacterium sp. s127]